MMQGRLADAEYHLHQMSQSQKVAHFWILRGDLCLLEGKVSEVCRHWRLAGEQMGCTFGLTKLSVPESAEGQ